ncbi:hypothetical protein WA026_000779 [Henosepilachna vigintioctopunctata]|uniref:Serpin domain-containing protein n=1 Tax=Henosepilachna vigintioctopunctata TaxID=420089 RepID=A0AAW1V789_9CUCU
MLFKMIILIVSALFVTTMAENSELQIVQSNGLFTNKLYNILARKEGNVFFSPISAHAVLAMSYLGSAGSTEKAYVSSLGLPSLAATADGYEKVTSKLNNVPNVTLLIANKVYVNKGSTLKENFKNAVVNKFHSEVENVDFASASKTAGVINSWVEDKTRNKIKDIISPNDLNADTRLVLVNAIYFKGNWQNKFDKGATRTEPFYLNDKDTIDVQMMHINKKFNYKHDESLKAKVIELPYTNPEVSLVVILPDEKDGIKDLEKKLEKFDLTKITEGTWNTEVELALPKFKIETTIPLKDPLNEMGLGEIFDQSKANFSNLIEGQEPLYVSKVIQKAFIEVNEEGAEAAAATAVIIVTLSDHGTEYFLADHPFIFVLKYGPTILFEGKCVRPKSGDSNIAPTGKPVADPLAHDIHIKLED